MITMFSFSIEPQKNARLNQKCKNVMMIKIDEQFRTLIPPLSEEEFAKLKENILKDGIRDKLVLWNGVLVDGHNRYRIATENNLQFETMDMEFESREHALNWIISNQLGRRNLNANQIAYLRGKRYETEKKIQGAQVGNENAKKQMPQSGDFALSQHTKKQLGQCDPIVKRTSRKIAQEYGVSEKTIRRNASFAMAVDILPASKRDEVFSGGDNFSRNETSKILKMDKPTQKKFIKEIEGGTTIKEAVMKVDPEAKRKEADKELRRKMETERELREKVKFTPNYRRFNDITTGTKQQIIDNIQHIPNDAEIWVFYKQDVALEARKTINIHTNLKIN